MISGLLKSFFGSRNRRELKKLWPLVAKINEQFEAYESLTDDELKANTDKFKERIRNGETVDDLLVEAFATVKSACKRLVGTPIDITGRERIWDMIPYDVQLLGGIVLHRGDIAEMQTGEGKTLVAILPLYLNSLTDKNCQLVTVNDYLARRDSEWVGSVLKWLGLTVGCIQNELQAGSEERRAMYGCDITYGTNSEFGFDYLRDMGMCSSKEELVQRDYHYAIVDEIDSILIDEARTPLIISGPVDVSTHQFDKWKPKVEGLYKQQYKLCTQLVNDAKNVLEKNDDDVDDDEYASAVEKLMLVKLGMPRHKQFMRLMQEPYIRRLLEKKEMEIHSEQNRGMLQQFKDQLFFSIDERANDADLSEKGRHLLNPQDPDQFVIPDLATELSQIDNADLSADDKRAKREELQELFDLRSETIHNISQLARAYCVYERDVAYIIEDNKVVIVDENTGRPMYGRRFSEGLHMALEAKEGVEIERETQTLATVTIQNYFRMYDKLAGMTGTAITEANEFKDIYDLDVMEIPTNRPCVRIDHHDIIYKTKLDKYKAIIEEIKDCHHRGQPVLLGTVSVEVSEVLDRMLRREKIPHTVLNAKQHQSEAEIVAMAGQPGAVTIATNMAGRGTDIILGDGVPDKGGLHVIASERHDSRRIDRQLRGRCARQGDPGSSRFYISLEDNLMRLFAGDRITRLLERFGFEDGEQLTGGMLTRTIEGAQRRVEQESFSYRKHTLQYDDVMNEQRSIIYGERKRVLMDSSSRALLFDHVYRAIFAQLDFLARSIKETGYPFDRGEMLEWLQQTFAFVGFNDDSLQISLTPYNAEALVEGLTRKVENCYLEYVADMEKEDPDIVRRIERLILLNSIDEKWQRHLDDMDHLRTAIRLHSYAQKDPLVEYKKEAFNMFQELIARIDQDIAASLFRSTQRILEHRQAQIANFEREVLEHQVFGQFGSGDSADDDQEPILVQEVVGPDGEIYHVPVERQKVSTYRNTEPLVGRNDPCTCGSGKKYKKCCGRKAG